MPTSLNTCPEIKVWIRHIEFADAEGENLLFHLLSVIGLEFQVDCLQKVALIESCEGGLSKLAYHR
jgi:hypothetical protein